MEIKGTSEVLLEMIKTSSLEEIVKYTRSLVGRVEIEDHLTSLGSKI